MAEFFGVIGELVKTGRIAIGRDYHGLQAENYDLVQSWTGDVNYYVQTAIQSGGPVLELACGTGRVGLEIARAGLDLTGVDLSPDMLTVFRRKLETEPAIAHRVQLHGGDVCKLDLGRKFNLSPEKSPTSKPPCSCSESVGGG
jgi:SAM-dependent methyltransferase